MSATARVGPFARVWGVYISALKARPLRTRMITAAILTGSADGIAQFVIEGRSGDVDRINTEGGWDVKRTLRLTLYGSCIFAPIAHRYLNTMDKLKLSTFPRTLAARMTIDSTLWSPFVCALFPTSMSLLEGKNIEDTKHKLKMQWLPTWQRAVLVFGPAQLINLSFVPPIHRLFVLQSVGLCWNVYLSWLNNANNNIISHDHIVPMPVAPMESS